MSICIKVTSLRKEVHMSVAEALVIMFAFGTFILGLLTYIHLTQKK